MKNYLLCTSFRIVGNNDLYTTEQIVNFEPKNNPAACLAQLFKMTEILDVKKEDGTKCWICTDKINEIIDINIKDI